MAGFWPWLASKSDSNVLSHRASHEVSHEASHADSHEGGVVSAGAGGPPVRFGLDARDRLLFGLPSSSLLLSSLELSDAHVYEP